MYSQFCIPMLGVNPVNEETGNGETQLGFVRTPDSLVDFMISQTLSGISVLSMIRDLRTLSLSGISYPPENLRAPI